MNITISAPTYELTITCNTSELHELYLAARAGRLHQLVSRIEQAVPKSVLAEWYVDPLIISERRIEKIWHGPTPCPKRRHDDGKIQPQPTRSGVSPNA